MPENFAGDKKVGTSLLLNLENRFKKWAVPKIPLFIETYHLTYFTIIWSAINVVVAFFAYENLQLLWIVNLTIVGQFLTDLFDGEVGRQRNTGLIKWGFYMDHFLDFIYICSLVFVGFMISPAGLEAWFFALLVIMGSYMVNSFLSFAATNRFKVSHYGLGPTEVRILFIIANLYIMYHGTQYFLYLVPIVSVVMFSGLILNTYQIQKELWQYDMEKLSANNEK